MVDNIEERSDRSPIDKHTILEFRNMDGHHLFVHHSRFIIHCPPFLYVLGVNALVTVTCRILGNFSRET